MTFGPEWHPDFILICDNHRTAYKVQTYKWREEQDVWIPARNSATRITELRDNSNIKFWEHIFSESDPDGNIRLHHETTCGATNCRNRAATDEQTLHQAFQMILAGVTACERARALGVDANPTARAFAALATEVTAESVTVTLGALRSVLHLLNAPKRQRGEARGT